MKNLAATNNTLARVAADVAVRGALDYLKQTDWNVVPDDRLSDLVCRFAQGAFPEALSDVKEALDAHMPAVAEQTFLAKDAAGRDRGSKGVGGGAMNDEPETVIFEMLDCAAGYLYARQKRNECSSPDPHEQAAECLRWNDQMERQAMLFQRSLEAYLASKGVKR